MAEALAPAGCPEAELGCERACQAELVGAESRWVLRFDQGGAALFAVLVQRRVRSRWLLLPLAVAT